MTVCDNMVTVSAHALAKECGSYIQVSLSFTSVVVYFFKRGDIIVRIEEEFHLLSH